MPIQPFKYLVPIQILESLTQKQVFSMMGGNPRKPIEQVETEPCL